ncbi:YceI family protein [Psychrobacter sp. FDAARGOS_221]|uniref:YceI family protein n=1 Tax=Psychrobacter sp. FDAARGOS_221 TaxID=1975705 RepID=UPI000BB57E83|nr:YceI family protein [Psychrobacter sp. FDAARGOS_221]PNK60921.1 polyisoprenoid-binding protein [Psychrobacter sp. FDAARGOS_221]
MKLLKNTVTLAVLAGLGTFGFAANAATYEIDSDHANVRFYVDHFGTTTNSGGFYGISGVLEYAPEEQKGFAGITIPMGSLETGFKPFTKHLRSADFFNVEKYPSAYFQSTDWVFDGEKVKEVKGNLTLVGQTHPVTLTATKFNCYDNPILKKRSCGGDFETTIDRTKWGINTFADNGMMKDVKIVVQIEATPKD